MLNKILEMLELILKKIQIIEDESKAREQYYRDLMDENFLLQRRINNIRIACESQEKE